MSRLDPAYDPVSLDVTTVWAKTGNELEPRFRAAKLAWAVPLGEIVVGRDPATTPIAWTRGLRADGTWASHSPYGSAAGGHIMFLGGNIQFYRNLNADGGQLVRYDGKGKTGNILEALPPGTRIGEYMPTVQEQREWTERNEARRVENMRRAAAQLAIPAMWLATLFVCVVQALRRRWPWSVAVWFLILTVLVVFFLPMC